MYSIGSRIGNQFVEYEEKGLYVLNINSIIILLETCKNTLKLCFKNSLVKCSVTLKT